MNKADSIPQTLVQLDVAPRPILEDVTVIIPTLGRATLEQCLCSLLVGTRWPAQVILVDQGTNPAVVEWLGYLERVGILPVHLHAARRGPAAARNRGMEQVKTPFFAAIDDDCLAETDWLEKMAVRLRQHPTAMITGRVNPGGEGFVPSVITSEVAMVYERPSLRVGDPLSSGNMGMALRTAQSIGPIDEDPLFSAAAEDNDWGYRALRAGFPIVYAPEVIIYHLDWRDRSELAALYRDYAWSKGAFFGKYLRKGDGFIALRTLLYFYRGARMWVRGTLRHDYNLTVEGHARMVYLLPGLVAGIRGKRPTRRTEPQASNVAR